MGKRAQRHVVASRRIAHGLKLLGGERDIQRRHALIVPVMVPRSVPHIRSAMNDASTEVDARYAACDDRPADEPDEWGDLARGEV